MAKAANIICDFLWEFLGRWFTYVIVVVLAILGKLSNDFLNGKKISWLYTGAFSLVAIFVSVMAALVCTYKGYDKVLTAIVGGAASLFSRDTLKVARLINWKKIAALDWIQVVQLLTKKEK